MSRIRTIKPEFWVSEQNIACSPLARLLFIGMWTFCDDHGVHPASYIRIKAEVFPVDECTIEDVKKWINELINNGLLREYFIEGEGYWIITGWSKHQRIDRPTYRHPLPQSDLKTIEDNSTTTRGVLGEQSTNTPRVVDESSTTERNGKDRIGKEKDICEVETSSGDVSESNLLASTQELFNYWQSTMNHPSAKLDSKRKRVIEKALKLGFSIEELKQSMNGCKNTPFNMGQNDRQQVYDDITLILRDAEHIERFMSKASENVIQSSCMKSDDIMAGVI